MKPLQLLASEYTMDSAPFGNLFRVNEGQTLKAVFPAVLFKLLPEGKTSGSMSTYSQIVPANLNLV